MPRHRRLEIPGAVYHVITRGLERKEIFRDNADCKEFLSRLEKAIKETNCKCYGWVLMPNHFHLLLVTGHRPLSDLMRKVLTGYAYYFNRKYKRSGYVYQNRYKSILCQEEAYLLELVRYIHLNPIRARIVKDFNELSRYEWSGHSAIIGESKVKWQATGDILERFTSNKSTAIKRYIEFIKDGLDMGKRDDLVGGGLRRSAGGWEKVIALKKNKEYWRSDERILGDGNFVNNVLKISEEEMTKRSQLLQAGWDVGKVIKRACEIMGVKEEEIKRRSKGTQSSRAKSLAIYWCKTELGIKGTDLSRCFGVTKQSISEAAIKGEHIARENNHNLTS